MTNFNLNKITRWIGYASIGLSAFGVFLLFIGLNGTWSLPWLWNSEGLGNLYSKIELSIKCFVGSFAIFAVWLTLGRMEQTERQIEKTELQLEKSERQLAMMSDNIKIVSDNNLFTNYYKHMDEFIKHTSGEPLIKAVAQISGIESTMILKALYRQYFYGSYKDFSPGMNPYMREYVSKFRGFICNSVLNQVNVDISTMTLAQLELPFPIIDRAIIHHVDTYIEESFARIRQYFVLIQMDLKQIELEIEKYQVVSRLYWTNSFYSTIEIFDGTFELTNEPLVDNYTRYVEYLGLMQ